MTTDQLLERITVDAAVCHGQPRASKARASSSLSSSTPLAAGLTPEQITEHYPTIDVGDVRAAAAYGAWLAKQEIHALSMTP